MATKINTYFTKRSQNMTNSSLILFLFTLILHGSIPRIIYTVLSLAVVNFKVQYLNRRVA